MPLKPMPLLTISSPGTIRKCAALELQPSDIFICSYPKSGTTWTQHIVISLLLLHRRLKMQQEKSEQSGDVSLDLQYNHVSEYAPFFEIDPHWKQEDENSSSNEMIASIQEKHNELGRRVFNTHLRRDMLPKPNTTESSEGRAPKFLYVVRSPLDVCVSFYHHLSHQVEGCYEQSFDKFFEEWLNGDIPFGSWTDHISSYATTSNLDSEKTCERDLLVISYEEMVTDLETNVQKIVKFLQIDDLIHLQHIKEVMKSFTFEDMKQNIHKFQPKSVTWKNDFKFIRKGVIGDYKELLKENKRKQFRDTLKYNKFEETLRREQDRKEDVEKIINSLNYSMMI